MGKDYSGGIYVLRSKISSFRGWGVIDQEIGGYHVGDRGDGTRGVVDSIFLGMHEGFSSRDEGLSLRTFRDSRP